MGRNGALSIEEWRLRWAPLRVHSTNLLNPMSKRLVYYFGNHTVTNNSSALLDGKFESRGEATLLVLGSKEPHVGPCRLTGRHCFAANVFMSCIIKCAKAKIVSWPITRSCGRTTTTFRCRQIGNLCFYVGRANSDGHGI